MSDMFGPAMIGVTSGIQAFQNLLPKLSDVRKADPVNNPDIAADVRMGEIGGVALTLGIGVISSSLTKSPLPTMTALMMCIVLVAVYESALRANRPFENSEPHLRVVRETGGA
jgi:hypothetical protein